MENRKLLLNEELDNQYVERYYQNYEGISINIKDTKLDYEKKTLIGIEGKTYKNLYPPLIAESFSSRGFTFTDDGYVIATADGTYKNLFVNLDKTTLKPDTDYTIIAEIVENSLSTGGNLISVISNNSGSVFYPATWNLNGGQIGVFKNLMRTTTDFTGKSFAFRSFLASSATFGTLKWRLYCLEGDYTQDDNIPLKYNGIVSVGDKVEEGYRIGVESIGQNLFDMNKPFDVIDSSCTVVQEKNKITITSNTGTYRGAYWRIPKEKLAGKQIRCSRVNFIDVMDKGTIQFEFTTGDGVKKYYNFKGGSSTMSFPRDMQSEFIIFKLYANNSNESLENTVTIEGIQVVLGAENKPFVPYQFSSSDVILDEQLLELPNGVKDEIISNKLIKRVGKVILNGSEEWMVGGGTSFANSIVVQVKISTCKVAENNRIINVISDKFASSNEYGLYYKDTEGVASITSSNRYIRFRVKTSKGADLNGFKQWLSNNPTTVYYELAEPTYEKVDSLNLYTIPNEMNINSSVLVKTNIKASVPIKTIKYN